jgi:hypothetical protein
MTELRTAHTADLALAELAAIRTLMDAVFDRVSDDTFDNTLGGVHALILEGALLYASRGWQPWRGPSSAMTPDGIKPTPGSDGNIYVLPVSVPVDVSGELTCDWRPASLW